MTLDLGRLFAHASRVTGRAFAARDLEAGDRDGLWVVRLAGDLMAYVPKDDATHRVLARERRLLARVAPRVSFPVPRPVGAIALDGPTPDAFDLREPVPGETGPRFHERLMGDAALLRRVAAWMGRALAELHGALTGIERDASGLERPAWSDDLRRLHVGIDAHFDGELRDAAIDVVARFAELVHAADPRTDVVLHGDFGSHNFAFDAASGMPSGAFDFHEAARGPRSFDLRYLPSYGEDALDVALAAYAEASGAAGASPGAGLRDDVRLLHAVAALDALAWRAEDPGAHDRRSGRDRDQAIAWVRRAVT